MNGQRYSFRISPEGESEGCCVPSSCIWSPLDSLPREDSMLLSNVGKAGFGYERWSTVTVILLPWKRERKRVHFGQEPWGARHAISGSGKDGNSWEKSPLFHRSHCRNWPFPSFPSSLTGLQLQAYALAERAQSCQVCPPAACFVGWVPALLLSCLV